LKLIIDATTTQDQMAFHGVGQYTKNVLLKMFELDLKTDFRVLLFNAPSILDKFLSNFSNVKIERIGALRQNNFLNFFWWKREFLPKIYEILQENSNEKDIKFFQPYFWRGIPSKILPTILMIHDMNLPIFNIYSQQGFFQNQIRKFQYWKELNKSKFCESIITNSKNTTRDFLKFFPKFDKNRIHSIHLGIDLIQKDIDLLQNKKLPRDLFEKKYAIYLGGGITKNKNSEGVLRGFAKFLEIIKKDFMVSRSIDYNESVESHKLSEEYFDRSKMANLENLPYLLIAGEIFNQDRQEVLELKNLAKKLGISENIIWFGKYEDSEKFSLLKNAFAFLHLAFYEGFGFSVVEAMRACTPVVAHKSLVYEEIIQNSDSLVDGENENEVAEKLLKIWNDENFAKEMVEKNYKISLDYDWKKTAERSLEVIKINYSRLIYQI